MPRPPPYLRITFYPSLSCPSCQPFMSIKTAIYKIIGLSIIQIMIIDFRNWSMLLQMRWLTFFMGFIWVNVYTYSPQGGKDFVYSYLLKIEYRNKKNMMITMYLTLLICRQLRQKALTLIFIISLIIIILIIVFGIIIVRSLSPSSHLHHYIIITSSSSTLLLSLCFFSSFCYRRHHN